MKKRILVTTIFLAVVLVFCLGMNALDTKRVSYQVLRAEANEDSTVLDLTTKGNFANMPASAVEMETDYSGEGSGANIMEVVFCGGSADGKTFTYKIYAWRSANGMARMVATGAVTLGTQAVIVYPQGGAATSKFWGDTITITTSKWIKTVSTSDGSGNNNVASLSFDTCGYKYFYCEITNADGSTGTEAGNVTAYYSFF